MKRAAAFCLILSVFIIFAGLCRTAVNPDDFIGEWYSAADQSVYLFQNGLLYCPQNPVMLSGDNYISGAYTFSKGSVFLFAEGVPGLEQEKELYLIRQDEGSFLCENKDGSGMVYFIRSDK